jgi:hypothetical protein
MMKRIGLLALVMAGIGLAVPDAQAQEKKGKGGGRGFGINSLMLAGQKDVQTDLKMDEDQVSKVAELSKKQFAAFKDFKDMSQEERAAKMKELTANNNKAVAGILNETQNKRLKQISLQLSGNRAFSDPAVARSLKITEEQKGKLQTIQKEERAEIKAIRDAGGDDARTKIAELQKATKEKSFGVLTDEQKTQWKELIGAPFTGKINFGGFGPKGKGRAAGAGARLQRTTTAPALVAVDRRLVIAI